MVVEKTIDSGSFNIDWKNVGMVAVAAAVTYLSKNFFTPPQIVKTITNEQVDQIKATGVTEESK